MITLVYACVCVRGITKYGKDKGKDLKSRDE